MLAELRIHDLAVIQRLSLRLAPGLNVLSGETGAGKSIIVGALSLLLGERASSDVVRPDEARAVVEGVFEVGDDSPVTRVMAELGIEREDGLVILRREIAAEGRSRAWINGAASTVAQLARIGSALVDLHGQSEHEDLVRPERQLDILDVFGGALDTTHAVAAAHAELKAAEAALMQLDAQRRDGEQRAQLLRHQVEEIEKADLTPDEEESLEAEARRLHHAEELAALSLRLHRLLYAAEGSITARLDDARRALAHLLRIDAAAVAAPGSLDEAYYLIEELGRRMGDYAASIEHDPARLDAIGRRQDQIFRLKTRYGPTVDDVIAAGRAARAELDRLDGAGFERSALARAAEERRNAHRTLCEQLSRKRARAATRLAKEVGALLPSLGMPGGRFEVCLESLEQSGASGAETIEFRVSLNAGFEPRPVSRVASGGELSRLMLALRAILARADSTPVLVFDEIDAGIGGRVAHAVADKLLTVSSTHQVFVVTHLAQIAARAQHHLLVEKVSARGTASANVRALAGEERIREIARLLGGDPESQASLEHARELLRIGIP